MNAIEQRCSVRHFTEEPITRGQLDALMQAAMAAPSARNMQPWEFLVVQDRAKIQELMGFSPYATPLKSATAAIVVCANATRHLNLEYDLQDCAAATENLLLQAVELGLGTCWLGGYPNQERVDQLNDMLNLPEEILPLWVIALGHPAREEKPKNKFCPHYIHWEQW